MKNNPVVHFEMPYKNAKRVTGFYSKVFDWGMQYIPKMGKYVVATTTDSDKKTGRPKTPGAINGGFYPRSNSQAKYPSVVIAVSDIKASMKKVQQAGGKLIGKPTDIPGVGMWIPFKDCEGNRVSILQPKM